MKRLDTSNISTSVAMPVKSGTLEFLQDAYKETINNLVSNIIESPITDTIYILSGCINSGSLPAHVISTGVLYVNGEIYNFDGASFTLSGLQKAYARIETTQFLTNADPVQFTDGVNRNVHNIRKIVIEATTVSSGLPEFKDFVKAGKYFTGETKNIVMTGGEYAVKFVQSGGTTGLGLFEFTGWAVMNGNNDTENDAGCVEVAYGTGFTTLEATTGANTHTVTEAEIPTKLVHIRTSQADSGETTGSLLLVANTGENTGSGGSQNGLDIVTAAAASSALSLMQKSKVRLRIQRIL